LTGLLELSLVLNTELVQREYEEEEVKIVYIGQNMKVFLEDGYIELIKGSEYTLPRWLAKYLAEKGLAKISEAPIEENIVARLQFNESRSKGQLKFEKLQGYFYTRIKEQIIETIKTLFKEISDISRVQQVLQSYSRMESMTRELYRTRLSKILNILTSEVSPEILSNLSEEEKQLYHSLKTVIDTYNSRVFDFREKR